MSLRLKPVNLHTMFLYSAKALLMLNFWLEYLLIILSDISTNDLSF